MNEPFPQWPGLLCKFVLPSGPKYFLLNLWITDSQATTPIGMLPTAGFRLAVQFYSDSASEGNRSESTSIRSNPGWASRFSYQRKQVLWTNSPIVPCRAGEMQ
jgi:hypothetical protein